MKKVLVFAMLVLATGLHFSCTSVESAEDILRGDGSFKDSRDGQTYKWVKIGTQTWMAENLNYAVAGSKCYGEGGLVYDYHEENDDRIEKMLSAAEVQDNCDKYGRLYDWSTAMAFPSNCNENSCSSRIQSKHRGICPSGWHIPNDNDWDVLMDYVGGYETAGKHLKAQSGWEPYSGIENLDTYGFSALPGGKGDGKSGDRFHYVGYSGNWWSASENGSDVAYFRGMAYSIDYAGGNDFYKSLLHSVRCLQD
jgi:uncharacterized protein (TIGR02145 family)